MDSIEKTGTQLILDDLNTYCERQVRTMTASHDPALMSLALTMFNSLSNNSPKLIRDAAKVMGVSEKTGPNETVHSLLRPIYDAAVRRGYNADGIGKLADLMSSNTEKLSSQAKSPKGPIQYVLEAMRLSRD